VVIKTLPQRTLRPGDLPLGKQLIDAYALIRLHPVSLRGRMDSPDKPWQQRTHTMNGWEENHEQTQEIVAGST
jgi:hypothetical protein